MPSGQRSGQSTDDQPETDLEPLSQAFGALSHRNRLKLLDFLTDPHYLREIASFLDISRQAAKKHVSKLVDIGVLETQQGERESGPVTEYVVVPERLFALKERFGRLGTLRTDESGESLTRTQVDEEPTRSSLKGIAPALVVTHGQARGRMFPLEGEGPWSIGRDGANDVVLDYDPFASNRHAEIRRAGEDHQLVDMFSTNGTFVNWSKIERGEGIQLEVGDVVGIGKTLLVFWS